MDASGRHLGIRGDGVAIRPVQRSDAAGMWRLSRVELDTNSPYFYLLFAEHFKETTVVASLGDSIVGFVLGLQLPDDPTALFVWQVAVDARYRRRGIALAILEALWTGTTIFDALTATLAASNRGSASLFYAFARRGGGSISCTRAFSARDFPSELDPPHEPELAVRITFPPAPGFEKANPWASNR